jgi:hypothetical protein
MSAQDTQLSLTDGMLVTFLASVPLWATAVFPYTSRPVRNICLAVSVLVIVNWMVVPLGRWTWQRLRPTGSRQLLSPRYSRSR